MFSYGRVLKLGYLTQGILLEVITLKTVGSSSRRLTYGGGGNLIEIASRRGLAGYIACLMAFEISVSCTKHNVQF